MKAFYRFEYKLPGQDDVVLEDGTKRRFIKSSVVVHIEREALIASRVEEVYDYLPSGGTVNRMVTSFPVFHYLDLPRTKLCLVTPDSDTEIKFLLTEGSLPLAAAKNVMDIILPTAFKENTKLREVFRGFTLVGEEDE